MVSSAVVVVSSSTSRVTVTHALKGATVCLMSGEKVGALEIGSLDGAVTVQLLSSGNRELSGGAGGTEKDERESSFVRDSLT